MTKDPVCGMQIDKLKAAHRIEYQGVVYYLCSDDCRQKFDADPDKYAGSISANPHGGHDHVPGS